MENKEPKIDYKQLTPEQRDKLELYTMNVQKTRKLEDIASLVQEIIYMLDENEDSAKEAIKSLGALFVDVRESIKELVGKENPQYDDKKVVEALKKLDSNFMAAIKGIEVSPQVTVAAPEVTVQAAEIDVSALREAAEEGYTRVADAIASIPEVKIPEFPDRWDEMFEWLQSIDTASRLKPEFPTQIKVINPDGTQINDELEYAIRLDDSSDPIIYVGKAVVGGDEADAVWQIAKLDTSSGLIKTWAGNAGFTQVWDDRTSLTYS